MDDATELLRDENLPRAFADAFTREQLIRDIDGRWRSGAELEERSRGLAEKLHAIGLGAGERVLLTGGPSAAWVIGYLAVLRAGLVAVPVNPAYTPAEMQRIRDAARPAAQLDEGVLREGVPSAGGPTGPPSGPRLIDQAGTDDPALLLYTSGTTGQPKGAILSHGNLLASARAVGIAWRWTAEDSLLLALPLFHMHGLGVGINGALAAGARIVLRERFDAADVAAHAPGATMFFGVPAMYQRLAQEERLGALSTLRLLVSGSAPLPSALFAQIAAAAGQPPLERYGMTETVMIASNPIDGPRKPGMVGLPLPGVALRLGGERDEIEVTGPNVLVGYDGGAGTDAFTDDGWFRTGDLGEFDADGYLRISGRVKELIISGGYNVYPREVEEVLAQYPGVVEVAVIGRPSERWGEEVTAVLVVEAPLDEAALRQFAAEQLAPYKVPKAVEFIDALPRSALGKIVRGQL